MRVSLACFQTQRGAYEPSFCLARRTARFDVETAWSALLESDSPADIASNKTSQHVKRLHAARAEVRDEVDRCKRAPPTFSADGRVALIRISSGAQVHPVSAFCLVFASCLLTAARSLSQRAGLLR